MGNKITILGESYSNIAEAARLNNITYKRLRYRLSKWGNNDPRLFDSIKSSKITLAGKTYPSLAEAAREACIPRHILIKNIR